MRAWTGALRTWSVAARYEWIMQVRRPGMWLTSVLLIGLTFIVSGFGQAFRDSDPKVATVRMALACSVSLPIGFAFLVSDRAIRDHRLHLADLLDSTGSPGLGRLLGKYTGGCGGAAVPIALVYLGGAVAYAVGHRAPSTVLWGLAVFATVLLPGLVMIGAVALCVPLVVPPAIFRILVVGFWLWSSWLVPPRSVFGLGETVLSPTGGYAIQVLFRYHGTHGGAPVWAGPVPGAPLNVLRPAPNLATTALSILLMVGIAAATLTVTHLLRDRRAR